MNDEQIKMLQTDANRLIKLQLELELTMQKIDDDKKELDLPRNHKVTQEYVQFLQKRMDGYGEHYNKIHIQISEINSRINPILSKFEKKNNN